MTIACKESIVITFPIIIFLNNPTLNFYIALIMVALGSYYASTTGKKIMVSENL